MFEVKAIQIVNKEGKAKRERRERRERQYYQTSHPKQRGFAAFSIFFFSSPPLPLPRDIYCIRSYAAVKLFDFPPAPSRKFVDVIWQSQFCGDRGGGSGKRMREREEEEKKKKKRDGKRRGKARGKHNSIRCNLCVSIMRNIATWNQRWRFLKNKIPTRNRDIRRTPFSELFTFFFLFFFLRHSFFALSP